MGTTLGGGEGINWKGAQGEFGVLIIYPVYPCHKCCMCVYVHISQEEAEKRFTTLYKGRKHLAL